MVATLQKTRADATPPPPHAELCEALKVPELSVQWLAGDGSDRCYYRLVIPGSHQRYVLMQLTGSDAENLANDNYEWLKVCRIMESNGISVPHPVAVLKDRGAIVIEDYGDQMFETMALGLVPTEQWPAVEKMYDQALDVIIRMLKIPANPQQSWCQRAFDEEKLHWELEFFQRHFMENLLQKASSVNHRDAFQHDITAISKFLSESSKWFVHRDFHSRNIMITGNSMGIIDFQDARLGPAAYDIVSLIFDSYIPMPQTFRMRLMEIALTKVHQQIGEACAKEIELTWRPMLLQRQLKALGSFGYLTIVKNRPQYRQCVGPAVRTLNRDFLADSRWPYLSGDLLTFLASVP